jgi:hypothetical protein
MDHGVDLGKRFRHVVRPGEIADQRARALHRRRARPAQENAQSVATLRQLPQEMLANEAGGAGQRDKGLM